MLQMTALQKKKNSSLKAEILEVFKLTLPEKHK
jgi:hypothetical protein